MFLSDRRTTAEDARHQQIVANWVRWPSAPPRGSERSWIHIPPVFGQKNFQHVVAHGPWGRTEKVYMKQLTEFRASADDALHRQIGTRTSRFSIGDLPTRASVNALLEGVLDHLPALEQQEA